MNQPLLAHLSMSVESMRSQITQILMVQYTEDLERLIKETITEEMMNQKLKEVIGREVREVMAQEVRSLVWKTTNNTVFRDKVRQLAIKEVETQMKAVK